MPCDQAVVAGQAAVGAVAQGDAVHCHQVGCDHILGVEAGGAGGCDGFSPDQPSSDGQCGHGGGGAVIHLARGGDGGGQGRGGDCGHADLSCGQLVIAGQFTVVAVGQDHAVDRELAGLRHVLAVQGGSGLYRQMAVAAHPAR